MIHNIGHPTLIISLKDGWAALGAAFSLLAALVALGLAASFGLVASLDFAALGLEVAGLVVADLATAIADMCSRSRVR